MIRSTMGLMVTLLLAAPIAAAPWGTDYNMGTFGAGGGSADEGHLSLTCGDPDAGIDNYGELDLIFDPAEGVSFDKKQTFTYLTFVIGDETIDLPIQLQAGSADSLAYVHEAEGSIVTQALVSAMRGGERVQVKLGDQQLGDISLEGSGAALEAIDSCIRFRS